MDADDRPLELSRSTLGQHRHVVAFFNGIDEQHRVLRSFFKEGVDQGYRAFHLVDPEQRDEHLGRLAEAGIDVQAAIDKGQLAVLPWEDGPLRDGRFDQNDFLESVEQVLGSGPAAGYPETRIVAHMEWALLDLPGVEDLIEFESRVNALVPKYTDAILICAYDVSKFGARVVLEVLRTHPFVVIGGLLHENPFFVPPEQFLLELRERRSDSGRVQLAH